MQAAGCAPIVRAWEAGEEFAPLWEGAHTVAAGIRVPVAVGDFPDYPGPSTKAAASRSPSTTTPSSPVVEEVARTEGLMLCPEGAATFAAWRQALAEGRIGPDDTAVLFNCATGLKYPMPPVTQALDRHGEIDWAQFR